ncbi:MAG: glycine cleavage system protein GcvH [Gammaproteobacteria bacterium]|nr:glycine cleavage system protein GcvH [Gammaproteobacteria bacterium]
MSDVPSELRYTKSHEWIRDEGDGTVTIGITDHAQELLGDLVFVELPEVGADLTVGDACCVVESVKAASDVYAPLTGEVLEVNEVLADSPEIINDSAFDDGWLFKIQLASEVELEELMDAEAYEAEIAD